MKRLDTPEKTNGTGVFGIDVTIPGMLTAVVARLPVFGAKVDGFKADKAKAIPGVKDVVQVPSGVAVVATGFWPAITGRDALEIEWDEGPNAELSTEGMREQYADPGQKVREPSREKTATLSKRFRSPPNGRARSTRCHTSRTPQWSLELRG